MNNRVTTIFIFLFLALSVYAQEQKRVAILNTMGDGELTYLSVRLREIAVKVLPGDKYSIMTAETIIDKLGSKENANKVCREAQCLAEIGRKVSAAYVGQARVGEFDGNLTISMELYNAGSGTLVDSFTGEARDLSGLLKVINEKAPEMFRKMPGASSGGSKTASVAPVIAGGISGVQSTGGDYEFEGGKSYLASITTEPEGAVVSFNGVPNSRCAKTPCKLELTEGNVRIVAALEQYERADTTVFIKQNNQSINIKLKSNFGVLEIKPAFLDGIHEGELWSMSINGKATSFFENKLSPGKYKVELYHTCYETLSFEVGINKGSFEFFDMSAHIKLKKGGLVLNAEKNGEPVSEPVFVNGKRVGETPFSGSVPVCAKVEIGNSREKVNVTLKANEKVSYTYRSTYVADNVANAYNATTSTYGKKGGCDAETEKTKTLYDKCIKMGKSAAGYSQCAESYKAQKAKSEQACRAGSISSGSGSDLESAVRRWGDQSNSRNCRSGGQKRDANCATILQQWGQELFKLEEYNFTEEQNKFEELVQFCNDRDNNVKKYPQCAKTSYPPKVNHDGSLPIFLDYVKYFPDGSTAPNMLFQASFILENKGELKQALDLRKILVSKYPNHTLASAAWLRIGEYYYKNSNWVDAIKSYEKITYLPTNNAREKKEASYVQFHLAECYYNLGDYKKATKEFRAYIDGANNGKYLKDVLNEAKDYIARMGN